MSELHDNAGAEQYELVLNGETVFARYRKSAGVLTILWVESPLVLRGTGAAGQLMKMLGATLLLFGKPWKQDSIGQWAVESSSITVGAQPDSPLADLQFSPDARSCTAAFLQASDTTPAFVHQGTHFNLCIPSYCLIKAF